MVRWTYLFPRLIIVALIALAMWVGSDPLIKSVIVHNLQNMTGAKIEIGQLRCSLPNQKIFVKDVAFADPRYPMKNLFQAEMAYVDLSQDRLLRREIVIEEGQASGVRFGAARTDPGILEGSPILAPEENLWKPKTFEPVEKIGLRWVDRLPPDDTEVITLNQLELVQTIQTTDQFWQEQLQARENEIAEIRKTTAQFIALAKTHLDNPLRPTFVDSDSKLDWITEHTKAVQNQLFDLQRSTETHRESLQLAHSRDFQRLKQSGKVTSFDSDSASELLLTKAQEDYVAEVIGWFHWFQSSIPAPVSFQAKHQRGSDLPLAGIKYGPDFLIRAIDLEGEGRFASRHFEFAGTAKDLTPTPGRHDLPATFELHAQGNQHLIMSCTLDRRNDQEIDKLTIICPDLELDGRMLGEENSMLVTLGPASRIQSDIQIQTINGQLTGELVFRHSNVSLHVDKLHDLAGGADTALRMNQGLAAVDQFQTRVTLSGTVEDYEYEFQSDLGSRFANAVNALLLEKGDHLITQQKQALDKMLSAQLKRIDEEYLPEIRRLTTKLDQESVEIASLRDALPKQSNRPKKMR